MRRLTPVIKVAAWVLTLCGAVVVFGVSSNGTLSLLSEQVKASVPAVKAHVTAVLGNTTAPIKTAIIQKPFQGMSANAVPAAQTPTSARPMVTATIALPQMTVSASVLNVHSMPGGSAVVGVLKRGGVVSVVKTEANWAMVTDTNGITGWVFLQYLSSN